MTDTNASENAALAAAAKFVLAWAGDMDYAAAFEARHMLCEHPGANAAAQRHTDSEATRFRNELESLVDMLEPYADNVGAPAVSSSAGGK